MTRILARIPPERRLAAWACALALLAPPVASAQQDRPPSRLPTVILRGPQPADSPSGQVQAPPTPSPAGSNAIDALRAQLDPDLSGPPRLGGWSAPSGGGGQCRMSCAQDRYFCRTTQDQQDCDSAWSQCVAACPARTDSPL